MTVEVNEVEELYDYDALRAITEASVFVVHASQPTVVLGSRQRADLLTTAFRSSHALRRRRGGGGIVLLQPDDLWVDWWLPADDPRWSVDLRETSRRAGERWRDSLRAVVNGELVVHEGPLEVDGALSVVCFTGRGPGEVFLNRRKVVGVTQWRVREGTFVSTVLHGQSTLPLADGLVDRPPGIADALDHHTIESLGIGDVDDFVQRLVAVDGPWRSRRLVLVD